MMNPDDPQHERFRQEYLERIGLRFGRFFRVVEQNGASAWLMINRRSSDFGAEEEALLRALAPHAGIVLRIFADLERGRQHMVIGKDALMRCGLGWIALDREARLVAADATALKVLHDATQHVPANGMRLALASQEASRQLVQASSAFAADDQAAARLIRLVEHPRLDLLALPMRHRPLVALALPTLIGFVRKGRQLETRHAAMLAAAYDLSMGEAHVALAICQGRTIRQAAVELGLTFETARSYSKRVYANTGTRGQGDLVREILASVLALA
jgi:DNA-binding CsgD family transcriptional regulator